MELVASRVDELGKAKITPQANQGTTTQQRPTTTTTPVQPAPTTSTAGPTKPKQRKKKTETAYADWDSRQRSKGTEDRRRSLTGSTATFGKRGKAKRSRRKRNWLKKVKRFTDKSSRMMRTRNLKQTAPEPDPNQHHRLKQQAGKGINSGLN